METYKITQKIKGCSIIYSHIWHVDIQKCVYIDKKQNLWKFVKDTILQAWMVIDYVKKILKTHDKIEGRSITCS